jgi:hypothetical protein
VLWICIGCNANLDPAFYFIADPDPEFQVTADPCGSGSWSAFRGTKIQTSLGAFKKEDPKLDPDPKGYFKPL